MGVPAFFKWLSCRYPKTVIDAYEKYTSSASFDTAFASSYSRDDSLPQMDNLYLDMNGIIHPCCRPENKVFF